MRYLFFLLFVLIFIPSKAQKPVYSTKSKKAIEQFEIGKNFLILRKYYDALPCFERAIEKDKQFVEAYIALAGCYRILREDKKVKEYLLAAFNIQPNIPEATYEYFSLATLVFREGDYKSASFYLEKFFSFKPTDKRIIPFAEKLRKNCAFAEIAMKTPLDFKPEVLSDPINQFRNQYFPSLTADGQYLLYTVRNATGKFDDEDLYFSEKINNNWTEPKQIGNSINSKEYEGASSISGDGKTLVFTYGSRSEPCDLYFSKKIGNEWSKPKNLGTNVNTKDWDSQPSLSADGRTLYFSSERKGGFGREDIWITRMDTNDVWTSPINAGPQINTSDSEFTPFIHPNGSTLYFASKGWDGMGGSDLFMSEKINDKEWSLPKNLGYPINTFSDELGLCISSDFSTGYYSQDQSFALGKYSSSIFSFQVPESLKGTQKCVYLKGKVLNDVTNEPLKANIELINLQTGQTEQNIYSDETTGTYLLVVPSNKNYGLFVSAFGFLYQSLNFNTETEAFSSQESFDVRLKPIKKNMEVALRNLFFETNKYELDTFSTTELVKLVNLIKVNSLKVEISGHTDNIGTPIDNQILSQKRANTVCNYLISKGIKNEMLIFKGYGETKPIGDNLTEEGRGLNRRIEIKILN
jgi:OmpA-OmpF porin, OOP family